MTFQPATWLPIAILLSAANLVAVGFAAGGTEPWHAGVHATLALGFGLWAQRLQRRRREGEAGARLEAPDAERFEAFEDELSKLRQELSETQERLDFVERRLVQGSEPRRVPPERGG
ncbi:MAG TPA: hypothetical protein VEK83_15410 [Gemmatimonadales bacterium]|nr:hypothetical protein [Gemmatimonadales bacterium]